MESTWDLTKGATRKGTTPSLLQPLKNACVIGSIRISKLQGLECLPEALPGNLPKIAMSGKESHEINDGRRSRMWGRQIFVIQNAFCSHLSRMWCYITSAASYSTFSFQFIFVSWKPPLSPQIKEVQTRDPNAFRNYLIFSSAV